VDPTLNLKVEQIEEIPPLSADM
ncbi:unnamed protein product, partial [Rotaria magnacalcarata]